MESTTFFNSKRAILRLLVMTVMLSIFIHPINLTAEQPETPKVAEQPQNQQNSSQSERSISKEDEKLWIKQIEIYGQIAKPQTVFIIPGTDPRVDGLRIDRHFFSHIFRPVEKSTLKRIQAKQGKDKDHILW